MKIEVHLQQQQQQVLIEGTDEAATLHPTTTMQQVPQQQQARGFGGLRGLLTWRERWPFALLFHLWPPQLAGLVAVLATWIFGFWCVAFVISKTLLPTGGWSALVGLHGASSSSAGNLPSHCNLLGKRYGVMFDAGSTGSRVHAYQFTYEMDGTVTLHHELFEQVKPGLSSYKGRPQDAAASVDTLLQKALAYVPSGLHSCTPVELKATAGLRLIGPSASEELLSAIELLFQRSGFLVRPHSAIVMDGKDEGPLAWVTVNFLLGTLFSSNSDKLQQSQRHMPHSAHLAPTPKHPVAILDMGGASTQIVFKPMGDSVELPAEHRYTVRLFGQTHNMYQHSHLGYGLKEAGKGIARGAVHSGVNTDAFECFPPGDYVLDVGNGVKVTNRNSAVQSFSMCSQYVRRFVKKNAKCTFKSCAFAGVYQPPLSEYFKGGEFYIFSYFYDRMEPFLKDGKTTVGAYKKYAQMICGSYTALAADLKGEQLVAHKVNRGTDCMDMIFLYEMLSAYGLEDSQEVSIQNKINGIETQWTLGAIINALA